MCRRYATRTPPTFRSRPCRYSIWSASSSAGSRPSPTLSGSTVPHDDGEYAITRSVPSVRSASTTSATWSASRSAKLQPPVVIADPPERGIDHTPEDHRIRAFRPGSCDHALPALRRRTMTSDLNPNHDDPAEGPRDASFSSGSGAETPNEAGSDAARDTTAKANEMIEQFRDAVEDFAEKAAPAVKEFSAKAAEFVAVAADKAAPMVQRAGEVTADASG